MCCPKLTWILEVTFWKVKKVKSAFKPTGSTYWSLASFGSMKRRLQEYFYPPLPPVNRVTQAYNGLDMGRLHSKGVPFSDFRYMKG